MRSSRALLIVLPQLIADLGIDEREGTAGEIVNLKIIYPNLKCCST